MAAVSLQELFELIPELWQKKLATQRENIERISRTLFGSSFIPARESIFESLKVAPAAIRVVVIGQDPYPNREHAMGLAFSVKAGVQPLPASLRNIYTELYEDLGIHNRSGDLTSWKDQGVLLLNRVLTTRPESSLSHAKIGWEEFTEKIIEISSEANPIAILWGKKAQELSKYFNPSRVISSPHPSPLSAYRGFFGSKPFSSTNEILIADGQKPINWQTY